MARKRLKNEFRKRPPKPADIAAAQRLARRVDPLLYELMEAHERKTDA
jgi:hypothetical protein